MEIPAGLVHRGDRSSYEAPGAVCKSLTRPVYYFRSRRPSNDHDDDYDHDDYDDDDGGGDVEKASRDSPRPRLRPGYHGFRVAASSGDWDEAVGPAP